MKNIKILKKTMLQAAPSKTNYLEKITALNIINLRNNLKYAANDPRLISPHHLVKLFEQGVSVALSAL